MYLVGEVYLRWQRCENCPKHVFICFMKKPSENDRKPYRPTTQYGCNIAHAA